MAANGGSTIYRNIPDVALTSDNVYVAYGNVSSDVLEAPVAPRPCGRDSWR